MTSTIPAIRVGDRITVLPGRAVSTHTLKPLTRACYLDVLHVRVGYDGLIDVGGIELTSTGAWRRNAPYRSVTLVDGAYTIPIRDGDTVAVGAPDSVATVTTIHLEQDNGTVTVDLLFADGVTSSGHNLATLTHISRAPQRPEPPIGLGHQPTETPRPAADPARCWADRCIASDCDAVHHVDATGDTWTQQPWPADQPPELRYAVTWHVDGQDLQRESLCAVLRGYSTIDDLPLMIAIRHGVPTAAVIIDSRTQIDLVTAAGGESSEMPDGQRT